MPEDLARQSAIHEISRLPAAFRPAPEPDLDDVFAQAKAAQAAFITARKRAVQQFIDEVQAAVRSGDNLKRLGDTLPQGITDQIEAFIKAGEAAVTNVNAFVQRGILA